MSKKVVALCLVAVLLVCILIARRRNRIVHETLIAEIDLSSWIPESLIASPDGRRVACVAEVRNKQFVVVDGKKHKKYDGIIAGSFIFSPDSQRVAYGARMGEQSLVLVDGKEGSKYDGLGEDTLTFSPDSRRIAYAARMADKWFVVVDAEQGKKYDGIVTGTLIFSPNSRRVAYAAFQAERRPVAPPEMIDEKELRWRMAHPQRFVVVDGKEGKKYGGIGPGTLTFSPDSNRVAYVARVFKEGPWPERRPRWILAGGVAQRYVMVVDGKEQGDYDGIGPFAFPMTWPKHLHRGILSDEELLVADGEHAKKHGGRGETRFSQDRQGLTFLSGILEGTRDWFAGSDPDLQNYAAPRTSIFSPDSKRVAYAAVAGENWRVPAGWFVVADRKEGKTYHRIDNNTLFMTNADRIFSSDSKRLAYVARPPVGGDWAVVLDGKEVDKHRNIMPGTLTFSPDSKRLAYVNGRRYGAVVVVDEKDGKRYAGARSVGAPIFSPDSKRLAYVAQRLSRMPNGESRQTLFLVVDGKEEKKYSIARGCTPVFSPDSKRLAYAARMGNKSFVLVDGKRGKRYDRIFTPAGGTIIFDSPDRLHYLAMRGNRIYSVEETIK
jgi:hypothetical protein